MKVILLENIKNLGSIGDIVDVKPGYGRNYLIPQKKSALATKVNIAKIEERKVELEKKMSETINIAREKANRIEGVTLMIQAKVLSGDKLFGSIGTREISYEFEKIGQSIQKKEIVIPDGSIKKTGDYDILVRLHNDVETIVKLRVVSDEV